MESDSPKSRSACGRWWRLPLLLALVLAAILLSRRGGFWDVPSKSGEGASSAPVNIAASEKVSLTINFGNGQRNEYGDLAWKEGMTVADLFGKTSHFAVTQKGSGQGTFLTGINNVSNEGADGRNWMYEVNGQSADRSFAVYELRPGDRVLWTFAPQR